MARRPYEVRFWEKTSINTATGCVDWTACRTEEGGYGVFQPHPTTGARVAHRIAYNLLVGDIPDGLTIDHLCLNKGCVNIAHLEVVTNGENVRRYMRRSGTWHDRQRRKTHCPYGHEYTEANTYRTLKGGRDCRACKRIDMQRKRATGSHVPRRSAA